MAIGLSSRVLLSQIKQHAKNHHFNSATRSAKSPHSPIIKATVAAIGLGEIGFIYYNMASVGREANKERRMRNN